MEAITVVSLAHHYFHFLKHEQVLLPSLSYKWWEELIFGMHENVFIFHKK